MEDDDYKKWAMNERRKQRMEYRQEKRRQRQAAAEAQKQLNS